MFAQMVPHKRIGGGAGGEGAPPLQKKYLGSGKVDKKNRGLQWIIKYNNANINCF
jgi:hypothetical protein